MTRHQFSVAIDGEILARLDSIAEQLGRSRSELVALIVTTAVVEDVRAGYFSTVFEHADRSAARDALWGLCRTAQVAVMRAGSVDSDPGTMGMDLSGSLRDVASALEKAHAAIRRADNLDRIADGRGPLP